MCVCAQGHVSATATYSLCVLQSQEREPWHVKTYTVKPLQRPQCPQTFPSKFLCIHPSSSAEDASLSYLYLMESESESYIFLLSPFCMITNLQWGFIIWPELNGSYTNSIQVMLTSKSFEFHPLYSLVDPRPTAFLKGKEKDSSLLADLPQLHKGVNVGKIDRNFIIFLNVDCV